MTPEQRDRLRQWVRAYSPEAIEACASLVTAQMIIRETEGKDQQARDAFKALLEELLLEGPMATTKALTVMGAMLEMSLEALAQVMSAVRDSPVTAAQVWRPWVGMLADVAQEARMAGDGEG